MAGWGRRIFALAVDWLLCLLVVSAFVGRDVWTGRGSEQWAPLVVFFIEASLLTALVGGSAGQLATRIGVRRLSGGLVSPPQALIRTFLICLVIPPVIYNRDQRGLHDMAVGSITVRR
ncbi:MAG TPA: RDD family protein [Nocardioidaceae bacterium]|nr:RDD family protein [Nocardioidaceae bacterium]